MKKFNVAVVGATGMVGCKMLEVLAQRKFPINELYLYASEKSAGKTVSFCGKDYTIIKLCPETITDKHIDIALCSAGASTSREYAPIFAAQKAVVIDNSSCFRTDAGVPLVVPEVNPEALLKHNYIIANPNCSTIQAVVAIAPLHRQYRARRIIYSTYQAVSGAGINGFNDLQNGIKGEPPKKFPIPIFGNLIPHIDSFLDNGYTKEEEKMVFETKKILEDSEIRITATTVRVPVNYGHSESINIEFERDCPPEEAKAILASAEGIELMDDPSKGIYPHPLACENKDMVFVGRVRRDFSVEHGLNMFVVADNIRKGAATNAVQIAEKMIEMGLI